MRPKRRKTQAAITLEDEAEDLTPGEAQTQEDAPTAQAKLMKLQEEICALKEERDFLREQLKAALQRPNAGPSSGLSPAPETRQPDTSDSDSSKSSPTTCSSSSSSDMRGKKTRKRKKKRHNKTKPKKCVKFGKRMKTSEDVVNRRSLQPAANDCLLSASICVSLQHAQSGRQAAASMETDSILQQVPNVHLDQNTTAR
ncbi:hypothetical protein ACEWY4_001738 [Coilia grayii]|uniref:Uncharacterized protein n=1 Tax=Coilia grayii TaxID=363190 RepID=A0ABD1KTV7_9TELE